MKKRMFAVLAALCMLIACMPDALAACEICGGDQQCDTCNGLGFLMARLLGSDEWVQVACTGEACDAGACTACAQDAGVPVITPPPAMPAPELSLREKLFGIPGKKEYPFADELVKQAVLKALKKDGTPPIAYQDLEKIQELTITLADTSACLDDLARMTELRRLHIINENPETLKLIDLAPLSGLHKLEYLDVPDMRLENTQVLAELKALKWLDLSRCGLTDVSMLAGLKNLQYLFLTENPVGDLPWLVHMTRMKSLLLAETGLSDLSPVAAMKELSMLALDGNPIHDFSPLYGLESSLALGLSDLGITDASFLCHMKATPWELDLSGNPIRDLSWAAGMEGLEVLWIEGTDVADVSPLAQIESLRILKMENMPDVQGVHTLTGRGLLTYVDSEGRHVDFDDWAREQYPGAFLP